MPLLPNSDLPGALDGSKIAGLAHLGLLLCKNASAHSRADRRTTVNKFAALLLVACSWTFAHAADSACVAAAKEKKLSGAARNSFVKKCEADAKTKCEVAADEKKLKGAAKNSNVKKCVQESGASS